MRKYFFQLVYMHENYDLKKLVIWKTKLLKRVDMITYGSIPI